MRNMKIALFVVVLFLGWLGAFTLAPAQIITGVSRGGTSENTPPVIAPNSLNEDELCYVDRTHQYNAVPLNLLGTEYIMVSNSDKTQADYSLDVTISQDASLFLFLDNRLGHYGASADPNLNPDLWAAGMSWVYDMGFMDTGMNIGLDEHGDGQINQWSSVYFKSVSASTITLLAQNDLTNPGNRNMYGVAALKRRAFKSFWYYDGPLTLVHTPQPVTVPKGYFGGWFWWQDESQHWHDPYDFPPIKVITDSDGGPWQGEIWDFNDSFPKWRYSHWRGEPYFWAFTDRMTFRYTDTRIRTIDRWMYFWDPSNIGNCLIMLAEDGGTGPPSIYPVDLAFANSFEVLSHTFTVNATFHGQFSGMERVKTSQIEDYFKSLPGVSEADVYALINTGIFRQLQANDPNGQGHVLVSHCYWDHPLSTIKSNTDTIEITEGETATFEIGISQPPGTPLGVTVTTFDPESVWLVGADTNGILQLIFNKQNWNIPQRVIVQSKSNPGARWIYEDLQPGEVELPGFLDVNDLNDDPRPSWLELYPFPEHARLVHKVNIAAYITDDPCHNGFVVPFTIVKGGCGGLGFTFGDLNHDCKTDSRDLAIFASRWLVSTDPHLEADLFSNHDHYISTDIDTTGGSAWYDPVEETWTVTGDGADIWGTSDQFHFVHKLVSGDFQITATVKNMEDTHEWAKAGLMYRKTLDPDSRHAMIVVTPHRGVVFQWRQETGGATYSSHGGPAAGLIPPISLRLTRRNGRIAGHYYSNGKWVELGYCSLFEIGPYGIAVTSHAEGVLTTATFGRELVSSLPMPLP